MLVIVSLMSVNVLNFINIKYGLTYLIYGLRGVGKTILLLNIFKDLLNGDRRVILDMLNTVRTRHQINLLISENEKRDKCTITLTDYLNPINNRIRMLRQLFTRIIRNGEKSPILLIDDVIPPYIMVTEHSNSTQKLRNLSLLITYLSLLSKHGTTIIFSIREDINELLPYMLNLFFITNVDIIIRIRKRRKIRDLYITDLSNHNKKSPVKDYTLRFNKLGELIIREGGMVTILKSSR